MTAFRSWLFVPGDSERKLQKSGSVGADVLIVDLEDSVAPGRKSDARALTRNFLEERPSESPTQVWVRVNPLDQQACGADLEAVMPARPDGIVLPKAGSHEDVERLGRLLGAHEAELGIADGATRVLPIVTETPAAIFRLDSYRHSGDRLAALTWGGEDLAAALGATANRDDDGAWTSPYQLVRNLSLFAAHAAGVPAIDTLHANFRDRAGLEKSCAEARRDGFTGKLAIHPDQVEVINQAFTPTADEIDRARRIVDLFAANPGAGTLALDGEMVDIPHLKQAQRILAAAGAD
jgi:citrate lyase subunit beta/citryl-CoA lyase